MKGKSSLIIIAALCAVSSCGFEVDGNVPPLPEHQFYSNVVDCGTTGTKKEIPEKVMLLAGPKRPNPFRDVVDPDKPACSSVESGSSAAKVEKAVQKTMKQMKRAGKKHAKRRNKGKIKNK